MEDQKTEEAPKEIHKAKVAVEEVTCVIKPEPGYTIDQALALANASGYETLSVDRENNCATIVCYKKKEEG